MTMSTNPCLMEVNMNAPQAPPPHGEIVLLAEDENNVRTIMSRVLRDNGYSVLEAVGGPEALALAEECVDPMLLLITDVSMPHMSGLELAARVTAIHPEIKVLYLSGYQDGILPGGPEAYKPEPFLQKPFNGDALLRKVGEVLGLGEEIG